MGAFLHAVWLSCTAAWQMLPAPATLAPRAASALFSAAWEGAVLIACAVLFLRMFRGLSAAARSVVWMTVFLLAVLLQVAPYFSQHSLAAGAARQAPWQFDARWSVAILAVWGVLSLLRGGQLVVSAVRLRALAGRAKPIDVGTELNALLRVETAGVKAGRTAELCTSTEVERPSVFGFFRPRILVPPVLLERLSALELRQVVVHEMEHLRRADDWTNLLQKVALVLFPLNPALLWVERRLCAERELACDDRVLAANGGRKAYALCLAHLAEYSMLHRGLSLVLGAWERRPELVRRVHRILRRPQASLSGRQTVVLTSGLIASVLGCALVLARSPQLVGFGWPAGPPESMAARAEGGHEVLQGADFVNEERPAGAGHAVMARAMMPEGSTPTATMAKADHQSGPARSTAVLHKPRKQTAQQRQAWIEMTEWSQREVAPGLLLTVWHKDRRPVRDVAGDRAADARSVAEREGNRTDEAVEQTVEQTGERTVQTIQPRYAAVPFANGWLIIQI